MPISSGLGVGVSKSDPRFNLIRTGLAAAYEPWRADGRTLSGSSIVSLKDMSGNGRDLVQATGSKQPTLVSDDAYFSKAFARFDGTDDCLVGSAFWYGLGASTVYIVCRSTGTAAESRIIAEGNTGTTTQHHGIGALNSTATKLRAFSRNDANTSQLGINGTSFMLDDTFRYLCFTDSTTDFTAYFEEVQEATASYTRGTLTANVFALGCLKRTTEGSFWAGDLAGLYIYSGAHTAAQMAQMHQWLRQTYYTDVDVAIMIGQSNADGRGAISSIPAGLTTFYGTARNRGKIYYKPAVRSGGQVDAGSLADDGAWWRIGISHDTTNLRTHQVVGDAASTVATQTGVYIGAELSYYYQHYQTAPNKELYIIKAAVGGSRIERDWGVTNADSNLNWSWFKNYIYGPAYADLVRTGKRPRLTKVWWMQGESDADAGATEANQYQARLTLMVNRINTELFSSPVKLVIGGLSNYYSAGSGATVKAAQAAVAAATSNAVLMPTDGSGSFIEYTRNADNIHYSAVANGLYQLGIDLYGV